VQNVLNNDSIKGSYLYCSIIGIKCLSLTLEGYIKTWETGSHFEFIGEINGVKSLGVVAQIRRPGVRSCNNTFVVSLTLLFCPFDRTAYCITDT